MSKLERHFKWITRKYRKITIAVEHMKLVPEDLDARKKLPAFLKQLEEEERRILTYLFSPNLKKREEGKALEATVTNLIEECEALCL